jgi:hypothetical protein
VTGYTGPDELEAALTGCDLVIIPAGVPRKPGMTRDDLFSINAGIVKTLVEAAAKACPKVCAPSCVCVRASVRLCFVERHNACADYVMTATHAATNQTAPTKTQQKPHQKKNKRP